MDDFIEICLTAGLCVCVRVFVSEFGGGTGAAPFHSLCFSPLMRFQFPLGNTVFVASLSLSHTHTHKLEFVLKEVTAVIFDTAYILY